MNIEAEKALRASIRKWDLIAKGEMGSDGTFNCPLCQVFYKKNCKGCPVHEHTKKSCCENTPYEAWGELQQDVDFVSKKEGEFAKSELAFAVARSEASFLRALLPKKALR